MDFLPSHIDRDKDPDKIDRIERGQIPESEHTRQGPWDWYNDFSENVGMDLPPYPDEFMQLGYRQMLQSQPAGGDNISGIDNVRESPWAAQYGSPPESGIAQRGIGLKEPKWAEGQKETTHSNESAPDADLLPSADWGKNR